jgi:uncharacterized protein
VEHVAAAPHPQDLSRLITDFAGRFPGVLHAVVVAADGVPVAVSDRIEPGHLEQLAAITAGLSSLADAAARVSGEGDVTQALVTMERGTLVIMTIDDGSHLAVLTTAAADLELVAYEMTMLVDQAVGVWTPSARCAPGGRADPGQPELSLPRRRGSAVPDGLSAVGDAPGAGQDRR